MPSVSVEKRHGIDPWSVLATLLVLGGFAVWVVALFAMALWLLKLPPDGRPREGRPPAYWDREP